MMKGLSRVGIVGVALAVALAGVGCTAKTPTTAGGGTPGTGTSSEFRIAVIPKGSTHEFWKSVHAGAEDAAKELGNVEVIWKGPIKEDDLDDQIKVIEDFTAQGVSGIVLAPLNDTALRTPVKNAQAAGIPVLIIDSDLKDTDVVSFVATDNHAGGRQAGEEMARLLDGKGKIVVLRYQEGSASTNNREEGFLEAIREHPGIEVLSDNQYSGATVETAQKASENLLQRFRNADGTLSIQGIYTPNESSTFGMLRTLQDNGWAGKVRFIGFDSSPSLLEGMRGGQIDALVLQNPRQMGFLGVKTLVEKLKGGTPEAKIDTGAVLVTRENLEAPEIKKLVEPVQ